jgi:hypothetical protein
MKPLLWAAIAVLGVFYALLAYAALNPKVSDAYRAYYITKTTGVSPTERQRMAPVELARPYSGSDVEIGFDGWESPKDATRWTTAETARIVFIVAEAGSVPLPKAIELGLVAHHADQLAWRLNGGATHIADLKISSELSLALDPGSITPGENTLELRLPQWRKTWPGDPDRAALELASFSVR